MFVRELRAQTDHHPLGPKRVNFSCMVVENARELDARFSPAGQQPILQLLQSHGRTRGLVYGAYGEGSADVHALISQAADG